MNSNARGNKLQKVILPGGNLATRAKGEQCQMAIVGKKKAGRGGLINVGAKKKGIRLISFRRSEVVRLSDG